MSHGKFTAYDTISSVPMGTPLNDLSSQIADLMRANGIKVANGDWDTYYKAVALVDANIKTEFKSHARAVVMAWCNVH
jgi:predicted neutral ceramidase superfamily lipid hydrolase